MTAEYTDYIHPLKESIFILSLTLNVAILLPVSLIWIQSKARRANVSDQSVDTNTSVGRCRLSQFRLFPNSSAFSSGSQSEVNIEEELNSVYVEAFRVHYDEEEVPQERLEAAIRYLNTREGRIQAHRSSDNLMSALEHIQRMSSRMDDSGIQEYTYKELHDILVESRLYRLEDFERVLEEHLNTNDFLPSPKEFDELHDKMKVKLEQEVAMKAQEVAETRKEVKETRQEVKQKTQALERTEQLVVESRHKNLKLRQQHQQREEALQQARRETERMKRLLQMARQRVWQLEQNPEGELQRLLQENERLKEENRDLWAKIQHTICSVCWVEEVQVSFLPCGHKVTCMGCADTLPEGKCPMCRENIQDTESV